ncbi:MAG: hypothetical protein KBT88_03505 [Gammaproteobacteria bacterium]|nr:hypothetical protein [Gammaproteobacteria bacterium]MBQ0838827.1 hypothetical protein [Gammaproteobacteria bacterium]
MGFFDSKSDSASAASQSGAQTQLGDPVSISISGKKVGAKIAVTSNVFSSDYGAIGAALNFADQVSARDSQLAMAELNSAERAAKVLANNAYWFGSKVVDKGNSFGLALLESSKDTLETTADISRELLKTTAGQSQAFSQAVGDLTTGFQDFVSRENNPGERVNLYLIIGAASVAGLFLWGKK